MTRVENLWYMCAGMSREDKIEVLGGKIIMKG